MAKTRRPSALGPVDTNVAAALAAQPARAASKPKRSRASYDLPPEIIQAIKDIAAELDVPIHLVAQKLLRFALDAYDAGELELKRTPVVTTQWTLE